MKKNRRTRLEKISRHEILECLIYIQEKEKRLTQTCDNDIKGKPIKRLEHEDRFKFPIKFLSWKTEKKQETYL